MRRLDEDVKMRICEDEKMRYRPPLLEEPCAQTLSGKKSYFRELRKKKTFAGCHVGTLAALAIKNPYMNDSHASISMFRA